MTAAARKAFIQRFSEITAAAGEHGEVRAADPNLRVFLFGPVTLDRVQWVSEREGLTAASRVERDGEEWMTVLVE